MKIIIVGATGLVGKVLTQSLINRGEEVVVFSRNPEKSKKIIPEAHTHIEYKFSSSTNPAVIKELSTADAVINLAGENVLAKRWSAKHKQNIYNSRVKGTRKLTEAILKSNAKLKCYLSASAVGIYGSSENDVYESSPTANDFLSNVVKDWESASVGLAKSDIRRVNLRIGIILSTQDGALKKLLTPFKFFIGGALGNGKQWFPWIHIEDVVGLFEFALYNNEVIGAINTASPNPLRMKEFCKILGRVMNRPSIFNVPSFVLKILFGEGGKVLTTGAKVIPQKALEYNYKFKFDNAEAALKDLLKNHK